MRKVKPSDWLYWQTVAVIVSDSSTGTGIGSAKTVVHMAVRNENQYILWLCLF